MSQLDELAKGPWLKEEEVKRDGIYWMVFAGIGPQLVELNEDSFRFLDTAKHMKFMTPNNALFHGPLTPPPL